MALIKELMRRVERVKGKELRRRGNVNSGAACHEGGPRVYLTAALGSDLSIT